MAHSYKQLRAIFARYKRFKANPAGGNVYASAYEGRKKTADMLRSFRKTATSKGRVDKSYISPVLKHNIADAFGKRTFARKINKARNVSRQMDLHDQYNDYKRIMGL